MTAKRFVAGLAIVSMLAACSTTKQLPREEYQAASKQPIGMHVVSTNDGQVYRVRSFSVTDSTFVIKELTNKDARYDTAEMPIVLPLADVTAVETTDARPGVFLIVVPILILIGLFVSLKSIHLD